MKLLTPTKLGILAATLLTGPMSAQVSTPPRQQPQNPQQQQRPQAPAPRGGLRVEIATARVKIIAPSATQTQQAPKDLPVIGVVANMSRDDLAISFTSAAAAERRLTFSLYDSAGNELWNSEEDLPDGEDVEAVLPKRKAWRRLVFVPLNINGEPLDPGVYTVELSVGADKVAGAVATFEVVESNGQPPAPPTEGGQQGGTPPPRPGGKTDGNTGGQQQPPTPPSGETDGQQRPPSPPSGGTDGQQQPPPPPSGGSGGQQQPPPPPSGGTGGQLPPPPPRPGSNTGGQLPPPPSPGGQQPPQR